MARATIKKDDAKKVRMYLILVGGIIDFQAGKWYIDTPDDYLIYHSVDSMMEDINENLEIMEEVYKNNNELSEWKEIEKQAAESKFHFWSQSDRMDFGRYE